MKKQKLNYIFHNPNTAEATAQYIAQILVEVNRAKFEDLMREASSPKKVTGPTKDTAEW